MHRFWWGTCLFCLASLAEHAFKGFNRRGIGVVAGVVGFDRVYLNVHWLSDVFGGWLLGAFWLSFVILVFRQLQVAGRFESERFDLVAKLFYAGAVVVAVFVVLYGLFGNFLSF